MPPKKRFPMPTKPVKAARSSVAFSTKAMKLAHKTPAAGALTIPIYLAGHRVEQVLLPDLAQAIRQGTGRREY